MLLQESINDNKIMNETQTISKSFFFFRGAQFKCIVNKNKKNKLIKKWLKKQIP